MNIPQQKKDIINQVKDENVSVALLLMANNLASDQSELAEK